MFFYLHFVEASAICTEDGPKQLLQCIICVKVCETRSVHALRDTTFHTYRPHRSRYTSLRTHATSPLGRVAAPPVLVGTCI